jgi:glycosyltransferase involved in cell wall biosynthesis
MELLILTQKADINDDVLGFMHGWIKEFSKHCKSVIVVCLRKGEYDLPPNVRVLSLGKEENNFSAKGGSASGGQLFNKIKYLFRFYQYIWQERKNYDTVFVHMNKEYVILGGLLWRVLGKKIGLWYAHGYAPFSLKIAERLAHIIFTSTKSGFRLQSKKINVVGQGIDVDKFRITNYPLHRSFSEASELRITNDVFNIITIGRISPVKGYDVLIKAIEILNKEGINFKVDIVGGVGAEEQKIYLDSLKTMVKEKKLERVINFIGAVPNRDIINYLQSANLFVNMSRTGSLDKAMVEAMACELPVLTCNEAMKEVLGEFQDLLMYDKGDYRGLAKKINMIKGMEASKLKNLGKKLRDIVKNYHSQEGLIKKIINILNK